MVEYIGNMLGIILEDMKGESETRASHPLFDVAEDATKLTWTNAYLFHHFVAQLLYLPKWAHPDIQLADALLCNRVRVPGTDYYNNLEGLMNYI